MAAKRAERRSSPTDDRWLSVEEAAKYLGVVAASVYRWIDSRSLPAHRVGRLWKLKVSEIDAWVRSGRGGGDAPSAERSPGDATRGGGASDQGEPS